MQDSIFDDNGKMSGNDNFIIILKQGCVMGYDKFWGSDQYFIHETTEWFSGRPVYQIIDHANMFADSPVEEFNNYQMAKDYLDDWRRKVEAEIRADKKENAERKQLEVKSERQNIEFDQLQSESDKLLAELDGKLTKHVESIKSINVPRIQQRKEISRA